MKKLVFALIAVALVVFCASASALIAAPTGAHVVNTDRFVCEIAPNSGADTPEVVSNILRPNGVTALFTPRAADFQITFSLSASVPVAGTVTVDSPVVSDTADVTLSVGIPHTVTLEVPAGTDSFSVSFDHGAGILSATFTAFPSLPDDPDGRLTVPQWYSRSLPLVLSCTGALELGLSPSGETGTYGDFPAMTAFSVDGADYLLYDPGRIAVASASEVVLDPSTFAPDGTNKLYISAKGDGSEYFTLTSLALLPSPASPGAALVVNGSAVVIENALPGAIAPQLTVDFLSDRTWTNSDPVTASLSGTSVTVNVSDGAPAGTYRVTAVWTFRSVTLLTLERVFYVFR